MKSEELRNSGPMSAEPPSANMISSVSMKSEDLVLTASAPTPLNLPSANLIPEVPPVAIKPEELALKSGITPPKRTKRIKLLCNHRGCNYSRLRIAGDCPHCKSVFCGDHRLPEGHECPKMEDCKQAAFNKNKMKLESEQTVASKVTTA